MSNKLILMAPFILFSTSTFACFNDAGCPKGNVCVKTGNVLGICLSQAMPLYNSAPTVGGTPVTTPGVTPFQTGSPMIKSKSQIPSMPTSPPKVSGTCSNDAHCPVEFVCSKSAGTIRGICTKVD